MSTIEQQTGKEMSDEVFRISFKLKWLNESLSQAVRRWARFSHSRKGPWCEFGPFNVQLAFTVYAGMFIFSYLRNQIVKRKKKKRQRQKIYGSDALWFLRLESEYNWTIIFKQALVECGPVFVCVCVCVFVAFWTLRGDILFSIYGAWMHRYRSAMYWIYRSTKYIDKPYIMVDGGPHA